MAGKGFSGGRNRKRRAGRIGRTKLKNRNYAKFKPPNIQDVVVKKIWDPTKSASVNMANMGLQACPNNNVIPENAFDKIMNALHSKPSTDDNTDNNNNTKAIELFDIPDSDVIPKKTKSLRMLPVSINDQKYLARLMEKHGNDYLAMSRDIKKNDMQHTEGKLKKMCARFFLLTKEQRRVDIPHKVEHLMC